MAFPECRTCLSSDGTLFTNVCNCSGSLAFIHRECLALELSSSHFNNCLNDPPNENDSNNGAGDCYRRRCCNICKCELKIDARERLKPLREWSVPPLDERSLIWLKIFLVSFVLFCPTLVAVVSVDQNSAVAELAFLVDSLNNNTINNSNNNYNASSNPFNGTNMSTERLAYLALALPMLALAILLLGLLCTVSSSICLYHVTGAFLRHNTQVDCYFLMPPVTQITGQTGASSGDGSNINNKSNKSAGLLRFSSYFHRPTKRSSFIHLESDSHEYYSA